MHPGGAGTLRVVARRAQDHHGGASSWSGPGGGSRGPADGEIAEPAAAGDGSWNWDGADLRRASGGAVAFGQAAATRGPSSRVGPDHVVDMADQAAARFLVACPGGQQTVLVDRYLQLRPG